MNRIFLKLTIIYLLLSMSVQGQYNQGNPPFRPQLSPQAPNSATLAKFGDYQVSYFTGVPDISIPLYEIKSGNLRVPISIKYHASGIKVTDVSGWVGLGWGLEAGGRISRRIMGAKEDEHSSDGYAHHLKRLASDINSSLQNDQYYLEQLYKNYYDTEPDIYSYSYPGGGGKFFLNWENGFQPEPIPFTPIKIVRTGYVRPQDDTESFQITDQDGSIYDFKTREESSSTWGSSTRNGWSARMLDKITSVDNEASIQFQYTNQNTKTSYEDIQDTWVVNDYITFYGDMPGSHGSYYTPNSMAALTTATPRVTSVEQVLQEINFKDGKVVFERSASFREDMVEAKSLKNIKIYAFDYSTQQFKVIKTITFYQSYFEQGTDRSRMRLDSISVFDNNNNEIEKYKFLYNNLTLPKMNSRARDFWGYYNGALNNLLIPRQAITYIEGDGQSQPSTRTITIGSNISNGRDPNSLYNQACMLKRIYYPTGGFTDLEFETNSYQELGVTKLSGGLRIRSIKSYDGLKPDPVVKTFSYDSARPNFILNYYFFVTTQTYGYYYDFNGVAGLNSTKRVRTFLSNSSVDIVPYDQATVVYPVVTEYIGEPLNNQGKTVYKFSDFQDGLAASLPHNPTIYSYAHKRGLITDKLIYKNNGAQDYQLLYNEHQEYFSYQQKRIPNVGLTTFQSFIPEGTGQPSVNQKQGYWYYSNYDIFSQDNYLVKKEITTIDSKNSNIYNTITSTYDYPNIAHQQVKTITTINSKDEKIVEKIQYPLDYSLTGTLTNPDAQGIKNLQNKGVLRTIVEKYQQKLNPDNSNLRTTSATFITYNADNTHQKLVYQTENISPIADFIPATIFPNNVTIDSRYKPVMEFNKYDTYGNILEQRKKDDAKEVYFWAYKSEYPIARIIGSDYNTAKQYINQSILDNPTSNQQLRDELNKLRINLPNAQVMSFTFTPLVGMSSQTDPAGKTTYFEYDGFQRLKRIRDKDNFIMKEFNYQYQAP